MTNRYASPTQEDEYCLVWADSLNSLGYALSQGLVSQSMSDRADRLLTPDQIGDAFASVMEGPELEALRTLLNSALERALQEQCDLAARLP